jgi:hypothetical protein
VGAFALLFVQAAHFVDVAGWSVPWTQFIRANITPFAWGAFIVFLLGLLHALDAAPYFQRHRHRLLALFLWSVPAWCYFDWMNFYFMRDPATGLRAWEYVNLPEHFQDRLLGYLLAFGAIAPGMFLTAEVLQRLGFHRLSFVRARPSTKFPRGVLIAVMLLGVALAPIPILVGTPASNLAIWVGTWALLDPLNLLCGRPSILGDWQEGRFGRTLALGAAGLLCGFLWEFWNYWAYTKWTYHLPFLGAWEHFKYFEMPLPGLLGFIAFALETWTMWQTTLLLFSPVVEGERRTLHDRSLYLYGCL